MTSLPAPTEPHVRAVAEVLNAALATLPVPIKAYLGTRPDDDQTCVVVHSAPGTPSGPLGDRFADLTITVQLTAVGTGPEQALAYADAAAAALLGTIPMVPGRWVWPPWFLGSQPVVRDDTVNPPLYVATAQYAIKSNPA